MSAADDYRELQQLEAEMSRLKAYVVPHEFARAGITLASVPVVGAACVFLLAGWLQDKVSLTSLFWMTILAAVIVYGLTREFRWQDRTISVGRIIRLMVVYAAAAPDDLDQARSRLRTCRTRIAQLKRSRR